MALNVQATSANVLTSAQVHQILEKSIAAQRSAEESLKQADRLYDQMDKLTGMMNGVWGGVGLCIGILALILAIMGAWAASQYRRAVFVASVTAANEVRKEAREALTKSIEGLQDSFSATERLYIEQFEALARAFTSKMPSDAALNEQIKIQVEELRKELESSSSSFRRDNQAIVHHFDDASSGKYVSPLSKPMLQMTSEDWENISRWGKVFESFSDITKAARQAEQFKNLQRYNQSVGLFRRGEKKPSDTGDATVSEPERPEK